MPCPTPKASEIAAFIEASGARRIGVVKSVLQDQSARASFLTLDMAQQADHAIWFATSSHCLAVFEACTHAADNCTFPLSPDELRDEVINTASSLGALWLTAADIDRQAKDAVSSILEKVEAMRSSGGLAKLNATYKTYRTAQQKLGQQAKPYSAFLADFSLKMIELTAQQSAANHFQP